jgi:hypothetical protein
MSLVTGLFALSAIANLFGRITHTSRTFTALWLFAIYVSIQASHVPAFDTVGILGVTTAASVLAVTLSGCIAVLASLLLTPAERLAAV